MGTNLSWRAAFWGEAIIMLPFAILGFVMKPLKMKGALLSIDSLIAATFWLSSLINL